MIGTVIFVLILKYVFWWVPNFATVLGEVKGPLRESSIWRSIALIGLVILSMFLTRLKDRTITAFGILEIVGGGWTIWTAFTQGFQNDIVYALAIGSGVFLLVNGFENILKGKEEGSSKNPK